MPGWQRENNCSRVLLTLRGLRSQTVLGSDLSCAWIHLSVSCSPPHNLFPSPFAFTVLVWELETCFSDQKCGIFCPRVRSTWDIPHWWWSTGSLLTSSSSSAWCWMPTSLSIQTGNWQAPGIKSFVSSLGNLSVLQTLPAQHLHFIIWVEMRPVRENPKILPLLKMSGIF